MKTYIVYNLDTGDAVAVGQSQNTYFARLTTSVSCGVNFHNLIAEEVYEGTIPTFERWLNDQTEEIK